jgi:EVE domain
MLFWLSHKDRTGIAEIGPVLLSTLGKAGWLEKDLENVLSHRIPDILRADQLMVVFQERKRQEEPDILALDISGNLHIFELKRSEGEKSNLLQVIRYGQIFGQYPYPDLERLFRNYIKDPLADLAARHKDYFELPEKLSVDKFNQRQQFVIITAGIDLKTLEAIRYWNNYGLPLQSITYHVYQLGDKFFLDFNAYSPNPDDYIDLVSRDYVVNTNKAYIPAAYREMLEGNKASAYGDRKTTVDSINKDDRVFLYHSGVGITAVGRATGGVQVCAYDGDPDEEHYIPLRLDLKVDPVKEPEKCLRASEINEMLGKSHRFRQTVFKIDKEQADMVEAQFKQKNRSA